MKFEYPHLLWLLLVLPPALVAFYFWTGRKQQRLMAQFVEARLLAALTAGVSPARRKVRWTCLVAATVALIVTLARPQWGFTWEETRQRGLDIVIAVDTSKSMMAEDISPNRLARAKLAAIDLLQQAKSDRLGLVAFAGGAFLQCPLTIDDAAFRQCLDTLNVNIIPQGGTAIAEAIDTTTAAFKKQGDNYKVLVLFTDGEDNDGGAVEAATKAAKAGLKIFTVGIGTAEGELLRVKDAKGGTDYVRDEQGNVVKSHLNEDLLRQIAGAAGGFYLPLRGANTIDVLYEKGLAPLPKSESKERLVKRYHERFYWPLALALLLLLAETLFPERRRAKAEAKSNMQHPALNTQQMRTAMLAALLLLPFAVGASPSSALREYRAGKYEDALKEYQQLLNKKGDDPRLHFNAGASAYRDGQFNEAAKQFSDVLSAQDLQLQQHAYYNLGNACYRLGENSADPAKKTEAWEKALKDYEGALKLNAQDADARFNHAYVEKKLEELKQQQQQQQNQDKKDQQKNQDKQDQKQQQSQQDQQQEQKQQEQQQQAQKDQQQKQDSKQSQAQKEQQDKKQEQAASLQPDKHSTGETNRTEDAAAYAVGQMTPQQARQLLDAQQAEEAIIPIKPEGKPSPANRPFKDW